MHSPARFPQRTRGVALIALVALVLVGALAFLLATLGPEAIEAFRAKKTEAALAQAREALLGYATRYRDSIDTTSVYGYLPLPDLGYSIDLASDDNRNNNIGCQHEGCDAGFSVRPAGSVGANYTVIGRFPWYLMGTEPMRDGYGECLWYAVSGSHKRTQPLSPMNWDTLGQMDIVVANGTTNLASILASVHDRPVAIIFSAGPPLPGQDRSPSASQVVDECGGNYDVANYLDPDTVGALGGVANFLGGSTNNASGDTSNPANPKSFAAHGTIYRDADAKLWPKACPGGGICTLASNDQGLALAPDALFDALRRSSGFRTDINSMLDRMVGCLRDYIVAGASGSPAIIPGYSSPADKSAGRVPDYSCYSSAPPVGYFTHWQDMFFVAAPTSGTFDVTVDSGAPQACAGVLIFAGQRGIGQSRADNTERATLSNYLEGTNLASFTSPGNTFSGQGFLDLVSASQTAAQDIVRCIPTTSSMGTASPQNLVDDDGNPLSPLASYDPGSRTLTLGSEDATTRNGVAANLLFGCAWTPEVNTRGNGFRTYFQIQFMGHSDGRGGSTVGYNGVVFAAVDGDSNTTSACGNGGTHLGFSGENGIPTPRLAFPKIGVEFDQSTNTRNAVDNSTNSNRNDPNCSEGHVAIVYWGEGYDEGNGSDIYYDDNVHNYPLPGSQNGFARPDPHNPNSGSSGVKCLDLKEQADSLPYDGYEDSYRFHVRVEVTPTRNINNSAAELSSTSFVTQVWIEHSTETDPVTIALKNTTRPMAQLSTIAPTLSDTATIYDVRGEVCGAAGSCGAGYTCGTDNYCYRQGLKSVRLGFTNSQRTQDQRVIISDFFTSWLP